jgi:hypothetical protein
VVFAGLIGATIACAADTASTPCKRPESVPGQGNVVFVESTVSSDSVDVAACIAWDEDCDASNGHDGKAAKRNRKGKTMKVMVKLSQLPTDGCVYVYVNGTRLQGPTSVASLGNCP